MNEEYKSNSHRSKEGKTEALTDRKKVEKVVHGRVRTKPKSGISKITDIFISEDAANVKS